MVEMNVDKRPPLTCRGGWFSSYPFLRRLRDGERRGLGRRAASAHGTRFVHPNSLSVPHFRCSLDSLYTDKCTKRRSERGGVVRLLLLESTILSETNNRTTIRVYFYVTLFSTVCESVSRRLARFVALHISG